MSTVLSVICRRLASSCASVVSSSALVASVQQQDGAVGEHGAGNGQTLQLALRQAGAPFAQRRVQTLLQRVHEILRTGDAQSLPDAGLVLRGRGVGEGDDLADGAAEQLAALGYIGEQAAP